MSGSTLTEVQRGQVQAMLDERDAKNLKAITRMLDDRDARHRRDVQRDFGAYQAAYLNAEAEASKQPPAEDQDREIALGQLWRLVRPLEGEGAGLADFRRAVDGHSLENIRLALDLAAHQRATLLARLLHGGPDVFAAWAAGQVRDLLEDLLELVGSLVGEVLVQPAGAADDGTAGAEGRDGAVARDLGEVAGERDHQPERGLGFEFAEKVDPVGHGSSLGLAEFDVWTASLRSLIAASGRSGAS